MFAPAGAAAGATAGGALGLSLEDLRQAFREFDLDKNGCAQPGCKLQTRERHVVHPSRAAAMWAPQRLRTC